MVDIHKRSLKVKNLYHTPLPTRQHYAHLKGTTNSNIIKTFRENADLSKYGNIRNYFVHVLLLVDGSDGGATKAVNPE